MAMQEKNPKGVRLKLAYLTTTYPSVSHTFIRRELREMNKRATQSCGLQSDNPMMSLLTHLTKRNLPGQFIV